MYIRMRVLPWSNTLLAWAGWDQFQLLLVNQPVVLLVQLNVGNMEEGKITAWAQFGAMKEVHQCIRMRVLP
jgi:hypothetical protein